MNLFYQSFQRKPAIGILASLSQPISFSATGGTEIFCALLAKGLASKGYKVYLFASKGSRIPGAETIEVTERSILEIKNCFTEKYNREMEEGERIRINESLNTRALICAKKMEDKIDLLHDNTTSAIIASSSDLFNLPIISTLHMPVTKQYSHFLELPKLINFPKNIYVGVARWQIEILQKNHFNAPFYVHNGIEIDDFEFSAINTTEEILWLGRVSPRTPKGLKEALLLCKKLNKPFCFSGFISDQTYFEKEIKPLLEGKVRSTFVKEKKEKSRFYGAGKMMLFPIQWEEPFSLVFLEAMACGTPIVAYARGGACEAIVDGVTGFLVNPAENDKRGDFIIKKTGQEGLIEAVERIDKLSQKDYCQMRLNCRKNILEKFTVEKMIEGYEKIYSTILSSS